jgi:hypothetical protein
VRKREIVENMMAKTIEVNRELLVELIKKTCDTKTIKYKMGTKCKIDADSADIKQIDCSGFVRWLIYRISGFEMVDGSFLQRLSLDNLGFQHCNYTDCAKMDDVLRIAFITPEDGKAGHVFLVCNGQTVESYGGHGVGRRPWNK